MTEAKLGVRRRTGSGRAGVGVLCVALLAILTLSAFPAVLLAAKQVIFSRSTRQTSSSVLGVTCVPAYAVVGGTNRLGIYVTATEGSGMWREMGLKPGTMLLTLDGRVIESASQADSYLRSRSGQVSFNTLVVRGGAPQVVSGSATISGGGGRGGTVSANGDYDGPVSGTPVAGMRTVAGGQDPKNFKQYSVSELEKYALDLINESRRSEGGGGQLPENSQLSNLARTFAEYMLRTGHRQHVDLEGRSPQDRAKQAGIKTGVYENFTWDTRGWRDDKDLIKFAHGRMMSEAIGPQNHRYNITLASHTCVGVGIAKDNGNLYMVHEFADATP